MKLYKIFFIRIKKIIHFLKQRVGPLTVAGIIFVSLFISALLTSLIDDMLNTQFFDKIGRIFISLAMIFIVLLIPTANSKYTKALTTISHKSYLFFIFFVGLFIWFAVSQVIMLIPSIDYNKVFVDNNVNIMFTIYGILTIIWFAYQSVFTKELCILRKHIQLYTFIVTVLQLFVFNKYSNFQYCISVLIITYTYIQYLFEVRTIELEKE